MTDIGIAWPGERQKYGTTKYLPGQAVPPPYWAVRYPEGYTAEGETAFPDLASDEHFQVWMRTAGLPTFRKLYFRNDDESMAAGQYELDISMSATSPFGPVNAANDRPQTTPSSRSEEPSRSSSAPSRSSVAGTRSLGSPTSPSAARAFSSDWR